MRTNAGHDFSLWAFFLSVSLSPFLIAGGSLALLSTKMFPALTVVLVMPSATLLLVLLPYVVLGWPALYFASQRRKPSVLYWAIVGFLTGVFSPIVIAFQNALLAGQIDAVLIRTSVEIGLSMGIIMLTLWSAFAAVLYWIFTRGQKKDSAAT